MVNAETSTVRGVGPWVATHAPEINNAVAVRRAVKGGVVQVCELANPEHIATITATAWANFCAKVRDYEYQPEAYGDIAIFRVAETGTSPKPIITIMTNYQVFTHAIREGRFDRLPPVDIGLSVGKWMTATNVVRPIGEPQ